MKFRLHGVRKLWLIWSLFFTKSSQNPSLDSHIFHNITVGNITVPLKWICILPTYCTLVQVYRIKLCASQKLSEETKLETLQEKLCKKLCGPKMPDGDARTDPNYTKSYEGFFRISKLHVCRNNFLNWESETENWSAYTFIKQVLDTEKWRRWIKPHALL